MTWLVATIAVAGAAWWWFFQSNKPTYHRHLGPDRFEWLLRGLMETAKQESLVMIEHEGSDRFLQFVKSGSASATCLGFAFPDAPWSRAYFEQMCDALVERGFEAGVSETRGGNVPRFVEVEFSGSIEDQLRDAIQVANIACSVMDLDEDDRFTAHFRGELDSELVIKESWRAIRAARE